MLLNKHQLERVYKRSDFCAKYISLPCLIVSTTCIFAGLALGNMPLAILNMGLTVFNAFTHWLNLSTRSKAEEAIEMLDQSDRLQRVRDLNPNKG